MPISESAVRSTVLTFLTTAKALSPWPALARLEEKRGIAGGRPS